MLLKMPVYALQFIQYCLQLPAVMSGLVYWQYMSMIIIPRQPNEIILLFISFYYQIWLFIVLKFQN